jgi:hypothetical protein
VLFVPKTGNPHTSKEQDQNDMGYYSTVIMAIAFETEENRDVFLTEAFLATGKKAELINTTACPTEVRFGPMTLKWNPKVDFSNESGSYGLWPDDDCTAITALYHFAKNGQENLENGNAPSWGETSGAWIRDGEEDDDFESGEYADGWDLVYRTKLFGFGTEEAIIPE